jgi:hypothetical protein
LYPLAIVGLNAVIVAVTEETPRILTLKRAEAYGSLDAIPFGPFDPSIDRTLELALRRSVREQTGLELGYVEQLYTFGDRNRDPSEFEGGPRVVSIAYLAFVREGKPSGSAGPHWSEWYLFLPWEDWRAGRPKVIEEQIAPAVKRWIDAAPELRTRQERRERSDINFGLGGAPWVPERVLERYELIYELDLAIESSRDRWPQPPESRPPVKLPEHLQSIEGLGQPMALDHRRILATALGRLRGKLKYRPVVFELLSSEFTLLQLQRIVEALAGVRLHKQNLRRLVETGGLVEGTARFEQRTGGRPAELFRFRREVLRERPAPGVGLPGIRH